MQQPEINIPYRSKKNPAVEIIMQRSVEDTELLFKFVKERNPSLIVELGHGNGGFTMAMHEAFPEAYIKSFDLRKMPLDEVMDNVSGRVSFINDDILAGSSAVRTYLAWSNRKFLYCDNGNKTQEVLMYAKYLNIGDMLGVHDYSVQPGINDALATSSSIEGYLEHTGFEKHHHEEFESQLMRSRLWIKKS